LVQEALELPLVLLLLLTELTALILFFQLSPLLVVVMALLLAVMETLVVLEVADAVVQTLGAQALLGKEIMAEQVVNPQAVVITLAVAVAALVLLELLLLAITTVLAAQVWFHLLQAHLCNMLEAVLEVVTTGLLGKPLHLLLLVVVRVHTIVSRVYKALLTLEAVVVVAGMRLVLTRHQALAVLAS
jgi:hypothetical protein